MKTWQDVIQFWFGKFESSEYGKPRKQWFVKDRAFDDRVRSQFLDTYSRAASGDLDSWQAEPLSCLALAIALDQFPRNLFRNTPRAFATDNKALHVAETAIDRQFDRQVLPVQRWFFYLPFEHSENLEHQHQSVRLFETLKDDPDSASTLDYADQHRNVIEKFGRFPHRNEILGRESTPAEREFLQQPGSSF
ncbi:Putative transmembrane protein [Geitlerinema sp. FC II]|nr:Putative transmembrane protein [Geitlerinema sp. FC II]